MSTEGHLPEAEPENCRSGRVVELFENEATVEVAGGVCTGCEHSGSCGLLMPGGTGIEVRVENTMRARVGDRVRISYSAWAETRSACILYLVPSISTLLGAAAGHEWVAQAFGLSPVLCGLGGAVSFFALGLIPAVLFNRQKRELPRIVAIIEEGPRGNS